MSDRVSVFQCAVVSGEGELAEFLPRTVTMSTGAFPFSEAPLRGFPPNRDVTIHT